MQKSTWLKRHRWLLGGILLACLALAVVLISWGIAAHQYQLALAHYNAAYRPTIIITTTPDQVPGITKTIPNPYFPPRDTSGPDAWDWSGWLIRLLAIFAPLLLGFLLHWWEHRPAYVRVHKKHLDHATNKLAEAINQNQELPEGVFDAYSKLRELEQPPRP